MKTKRTHNPRRPGQSLERVVRRMGEIADDMIERYGYPNEDGPPEPEDYLDMTDEELRKATAMGRSAKLKSIRAWPHALSPKQRYCLVAWLAEHDAKYA